MDREKIIQMARDVGIVVDPISAYGGLIDGLERFSSSIVAANKEESARIFEDLSYNAKRAIELRFQQIADSIRASK